jgi:hypothetical protein
MIKISEFEGRHVAWDPENMSHVTRHGISEANAIARLKSAYLDVNPLRKKIDERRKAIAAVAARR